MRQTIGCLVVLFICNSSWADTSNFLNPRMLLNDLPLGTRFKLNDGAVLSHRMVDFDREISVVQMFDDGESVDWNDPPFYFNFVTPTSCFLGIKPELKNISTNWIPLLANSKVVLPAGLKMKLIKNDIKKFAVILHLELIDQPLTFGYLIVKKIYLTCTLGEGEYLIRNNSQLSLDHLFFNMGNNISIFPKPNKS
jgi:hypothetical protein